MDWNLQDYKAWMKSSEAQEMEERNACTFLRTGANNIVFLPEKKRDRGFRLWMKDAIVKVTAPKNEGLCLSSLFFEYSAKIIIQFLSEDQPSTFFDEWLSHDEVKVAAESASQSFLESGAAIIRSMSRDQSSAAFAAWLTDPTVQVAAKKEPAAFLRFSCDIIKSLPDDERKEIFAAWLTDPTVQAAAKKEPAAFLRFSCDIIKSLPEDERAEAFKAWLNFQDVQDAVKKQPECFLGCVENILMSLSKEAFQDWVNNEHVLEARTKEPEAFYGIVCRYSNLLKEGSLLDLKKSFDQVVSCYDKTVFVSSAERDVVVESVESDFKTLSQKFLDKAEKAKRSVQKALDVVDAYIEDFDIGKAFKKPVRDIDKIRDQVLDRVNQIKVINPPA